MSASEATACAANVGVMPAMGTPVVDVGCRVTREELTEHLAAATSEDAPMFRAFFERDARGGIVCATCGQTVGRHASRADQATAAAAAKVRAADTPANAFAPPTHLSPPPLTVGEYLTAARGVAPGVPNDRIPVPAHWTAAAWWLPFVAFDRYGKRMQDDWRSNRFRLRFTATVVLRCTLPTSDGTPCDHRFEVRGFPLQGDDEKTEGVPDVTLAVANSPGAADAIDSHMAVAHDVHHVTAGGWTTGLCGCCEHPCSVVSLLSYPCFPAFFADVRVTGLPFQWALTEALGPGAGMMTMSRSERTLIVPQRPPEHSECTWAYCGNALCVFYIGVHVMMKTLWFLGSLFTLCGFPCTDIPPLLCCGCFQRRRFMVKMLDADESELASKCAVVFCCALSELQVWRETHYSGVWPGLCTRAANSDDLRTMSPSALRQRYGVGGDYGVRFGPRAPRQARDVLRSSSPPLIAFPPPPGQPGMADSPAAAEDDLEASSFGRKMRMMNTVILAA